MSPGSFMLHCGVFFPLNGSLPKHDRFLQSLRLVWCFLLLSASTLYISNHCTVTHRRQTRHAGFVVLNCRFGIERGVGQKSLEITESREERSRRSCLTGPPTRTSTRLAVKPGRLIFRRISLGKDSSRKSQNLDKDVNLDRLTPDDNRLLAEVDLQVIVGAGIVASAVLLHGLVLHPE